MADTESTLAAGRRLARDLRSIRRKLGIDLKEILDQTRLAEDVIEQLEETALMGNPVFNQVYLRSLYSSYGSVLKVSHADMMQALEEATSGHYIGSLATKYLGETITVPEENEETDVDPEVVEQAEETESESEHPPVEEDPSELDEADDSEPEPDDTIPDEPDAVEVVAPFVPTPADRTGHSEMGSLEKFLRERSTVLLPNMSGFLILIVAGAALIAMIWFSVSWLMSSPEPIVEEEIVSDSSEVFMIPAPAPVVLLDTFQVDIIAQLETLDPVRITQDRDLRRPYWIQHLDTLSFQISERIEIERELMNARILVDNFVLPSEWYQEEVRVEISRQMIQSWLDSLTTAGVFPPRADDSE